MERQCLRWASTWLRRAPALTTDGHVLLEQQIILFVCERERGNDGAGGRQDGGTHDDWWDESRRDVARLGGRHVHGRRRATGDPMMVTVPAARASSELNANTAK